MGIIGNSNQNSGAMLLILILFILLFSGDLFTNTQVG